MSFHEFNVASLSPKYSYIRKVEDHVYSNNALLEGDRLYSKSFNAGLIVLESDVRFSVCR